MNYKPTLLALSIGLALNVQAQQEPQPEQAAEDVEVITVTGIRGSLASAINTKRASDKIIDSVNAEDMGKLPDVNLAESLQRISGIAITRENGEGAQISIRGIQPNLNLVTVNGQTIATPSGSRSFAFNTISPGVVSGINIVKTPTADLTEGGIGGTIDLQIKGALNQPEKSVVQARGIYDDMTNSWGKNVNAIFSRKLADNFGATGSVEIMQRDVRRDWIGFDHYAQPWMAKTIGGEEVFVPRMFTQGTRIDDRDRTSASLNFHYRPIDDLDIRLTSLYTNEERSQETQRIRWQVTNPAKGWDASSFVFAEDGKTVLSATTNKHASAFVEPFAVAEEVEEQTYAINLDVEYTFDQGKVSGNLSKTRATWDEDELNSLFRYKNGPIFSYSINPDAPEQPSVDFGGAFDDLTKFTVLSINAVLDNFEDEETAIKFDVDRYVEWGWIHTIEAGVRYSEHEYAEHRQQDRVHQGDYRPSGTFADYVSDGFLNDNWLSRGSAEYANTTYVNTDIDALFDGVQFNYTDELGRIWRTEEDVTAVYLQAQFSNDYNLSGVVGVRHVDTSQTTYDSTTKTDNDYDNTLLTVNINYTITEDIYLRAAYADVMARPEYGDLQPNFTLNESIGAANGGNPWLAPYEASQYDLALEWYFEEGGMLSGAIFYKDIDSFIEKNIVSERELFDGDGNPITWEDEEGNISTIWDYTSNGNGDGASIEGFELTYQQQFESGVGVLMNYTYADSDTPYEDWLGAGIPMLNSSEDTFNGVLYYEQDNYSARLAYNYRSDFVSKIDAGGGVQMPMVTDGAGYLDFSATYKPMKNLQLVMNIINLTEQERVAFIGSPLRANAYRDDTSRRFVIGARYTF